jgi:hypothetical protein
MQFEKLPADVIRYTAQKLPSDEIISLCSTSKRFNDAVCKNREFWLYLFRRDMTSDPTILAELSKKTSEFLKDEYTKYFSENLDDKSIKELAFKNYNLRLHDILNPKQILVPTKRLLKKKPPKEEFPTFPYSSEYKSEPSKVPYVLREAFVEAARGGHLQLMNDLIEEYKQKFPLDKVLNEFPYEHENFYVSLHDALVAATKGGYLEIIYDLIDNYEVNPKYNIARLIAYAAEKGHKDIMQYYIDIILTTNDYLSLSNALDATVESKTLTNEEKKNILEYLLTYKERAVDFDLTSPLKHRAYEGDVELTRYLMNMYRENYEYHRKKYDGKWPYDSSIDFSFVVEAAASSGHLQIVKDAIENGIRDPIELNKSLREASEKGYLDIVKYLIEYGADPNVGFVHSNILIPAAAHGQMAVVKYLLETKNLNIDIHADNDAALNLAVSNGLWHPLPNKYQDLAIYLLSNGADINVLTEDQIERMNLEKYKPSKKVTPKTSPKTLLKKSPVPAKKSPIRAKAPTVSPKKRTPALNSSKQCKAITKSNVRCSRTANPGSDYCWQHQP